MNRSIPATYPFPDADRSFVPGSYKINAGASGITPPQGPQALAGALRHLFGFGHACHIWAQGWPSAEAGYETVNAFPGTETGRVRIPHDAGFVSFKVIVDYEAVLALTPGFRLTFKELGQSVDLDTVAAGGAVRRVVTSWSPAGMAAYGGAYHTLELYAKGNGSGSKNKILGVWVERVGYSADIPAGKFYSGEFITPDGDAFGPDKPLTTDKMRDLKSCTGALADARKKAFLTWSAIRNGGGSYDSVAFISALAPIRTDPSRINTLDFGWIKTGGIGSDDNLISGGRAGTASADAYLVTVGSTGWVDFSLGLQAEDPLFSRASGEFQHIICDPSLIAYLESLTIFGP